MSGLYIHIPFCKTKCGYCDFYSNSETYWKKPLIAALLKEMQQTSDFLDNSVIETIYFGGGTPTQLMIDELGQILEHIYKYYRLSFNPEITIEANPDDLNPEYLNQLITLGFNRISIGIQSFENEGLKFMNRRHDSKQAIRSVEEAYSAGFQNISIDLIYGYPGLLEDSWKQNLEIAFQLPVVHLSAYHLIYEEGTPFFKLKQERKIAEVHESVSEEHYEILCKYSSRYGFDHYEISNFAKTGWHSRHNSNYWNNTPYLGLGPSAHSYKNNQRRWNISDTSRYIQAINNGNQAYESETLKEKDQVNEFLMTQLRTSKGFDLNVFEKLFGSKRLWELQKKLETSKGLIVEQSKVCIPEKLLLVSDPIISGLFC